MRRASRGTQWETQKVVASQGGQGMQRVAFGNSAGAVKDGMEADDINTANSESILRIVCKVKLVSMLSCDTQFYA